MKLDTIKLFDPSSREVHGENYLITIDVPLVNSEGNDIGGQVVGNMTNEFQVDMNAQWEEMLSSSNLGALGNNVQTAATITGNPLFSSGVFTQKFFKGGSPCL